MKNTTLWSLVAGPGNPCKNGKIPNVIKLSQTSGLFQVGGELANPNIVDSVGVRKLTANLRYAIFC